MESEFGCGNIGRGQEWMQVMNASEFHHVLKYLDTLSPEQLRQLRHELDHKMVEVEAKGPATNDEELQRRLFEAGLLSEIKPPLTDLAPYQNRKAVPIQGEPLSQTVIRERR
jgi:hypothetical protein